MLASVSKIWNLDNIVPKRDSYICSPSFWLPIAAPRSGQTRPLCITQSWTPNLENEVMHWVTESFIQNHWHITPVAESRGKAVGVKNPVWPPILHRKKVKTRHGRTKQGLPRPPWGPRPRTKGRSLWCLTASHKCPTQCPNLGKRKREKALKVVRRIMKQNGKALSVAKVDCKSPVTAGM